MEDVNLLKRIRFWGRFDGVMLIIVGVVVAIEGLLSSVIGAIPGAISAMGGFYIFKTGKDAAQILQDRMDNTEGVQSLLKNYGYFLQITGTLLMIAIALYIILLVSLGVLED